MGGRRKTWEWKIIIGRRIFKRKKKKIRQGEKMIGKMVW